MLHPLKQAIKVVLRRAHANAGKSHVTAEERDVIHEYRISGLTIKAIAAEVGRAPSTVRKALQDYVDDSDPLPISFDTEEDHTPTRPSHSHRDLGEKLAARVEPLILDHADALMDSNPEFLTEVIAKTMGIKLAKRTLDTALEESALEELQESPHLRRRAAEAYLHERERGGRTESDIWLEAFATFCTLLDRAKDGEWARAVRDMVNSGEARQALVESLKVLRAAPGVQEAVQSPGTPVEQPTETLEVSVDP